MQDDGQAPASGAEAPQAPAAQPQPPDWPTLIAEAAAKRPASVRALTYVKKWKSASAPVLLTCDDNHAYVVKGAYAGRQVVNDHVVGSLGVRMGAPVAEVTLVDVSAELVENEPELKDLREGQPFVPGVWHGSRFVQGLSDDREGFNHTGLPENRSRFALLALLFGWAQANDPQFLYAKAPPEMVHSMDHGHFFPEGPNWTVAKLQAAAGAQPDSQICSSCKLTPEELEAARLTLAALDAVDAIAAAIGVPPDHWPISAEERNALALFLHPRHGALSASPTPPTPPPAAP